MKGSAADYNEWAERVGDDAWQWKTVKKDFAAIETYEFDGAKEYAHLSKPEPDAHGTSGKIKVGLPPQLEKGVLETMQALVDAGEEINLDPNSGNPMGMSVFPYSYSKNGRVTSAIAYLQDTPNNLKVWTDASATKFVWSDTGEKVAGIEIKDGRKGRC